ncbi:MAG TPA: hypothetical protein VMR45_03620 [Patescibacteria group bacterium]|nr:hypothetical protein [Patescibacteria group bacterium]
MTPGEGIAASREVLEAGNPAAFSENAKKALEGAGAVVGTIDTALGQASAGVRAPQQQLMSAASAVFKSCETGTSLFHQATGPDTAHVPKLALNRYNTALTESSRILPEIARRYQEVYGHLEAAKKAGRELLELVGMEGTRANETTAAHAAALLAIDKYREQIGY